MNPIKRTLLRNRARNHKVDEYQTRIKRDIINQVAYSIKFMKGHTYKINYKDSYTPVWYLILGLSNDLAGFDYMDFDLDDYDFQSVGEVVNFYDQVADESTEHPYLRNSDKQTAQKAKNTANRLGNDYSDAEILDCYNFKVPHPLTNADISKIFHDFKQAILHSKFTKGDMYCYYHNYHGQSIINWCD